MLHPLEGKYRAMRRHFLERTGNEVAQKLKDGKFFTQYIKCNAHIQIYPLNCNGNFLSN